jgi:acyl-coenzyme A thioesterase PaaI-like protein
MVSDHSTSWSVDVHLDGDHPHFVGAMGLDHWFEEDTTWGKAAISQRLCIPDTPYPRISVLTTMADIVSGTRPSGVINPTVDIHIQVMTLVPTSIVRLRSDALRVGRRLFVGETLLYANDEERPFARSLVTFINKVMVIPEGHSAPPLTTAQPLRVGIDDLLDVRVVDRGTIEIDPIARLSNGPGGTVQGGVLALLGELATEQALAPSTVAVTDLDIRYLNPVRVGPVQARAEILSESPQEAAVNVRIVDVGDADRLVAYVGTTARRL